MNCQEGMQDDFYLLTGWPFFLPISGSGGSGNAGQDLSDLQPPTERSDRSSALLHSRIQPSQSHCCAEPIQIHRQTDRYADRHTHTDRSSALLHSRKQPLPCNKPDFNLVLTFLIAYYSWSGSPTHSMTVKSVGESDLGKAGEVIEYLLFFFLFIDWFGSLYQNETFHIYLYNKFTWTNVQLYSYKTRTSRM